MDTIRYDLKTLNRQFHLASKQKTASTNNLIALLEQTFPGVRKCFDSPVRSDDSQKWVDFVITFEELVGMFEAKEIILNQIQAEDEMKDATGAGRGYGVAGGVASAIEKCIREYYPETEVRIEHAESLAECKKILMMAKAGKKNGCLIEGMACPGGCVAGAGTNIAITQANKEVSGFVKAAKQPIPDKQ